MTHGYYRLWVYYIVAQLVVLISNHVTITFHYKVLWEVSTPLKWDHGKTDKKAFFLSPKNIFIQRPVWRYLWILHPFLWVCYLPSCPAHHCKFRNHSSLPSYPATSLPCYPATLLSRYFSPLLQKPWPFSQVLISISFICSP